MDGTRVPGRAHRVGQGNAWEGNRKTAGLSQVEERKREVFQASRNAREANTLATSGWTNTRSGSLGQGCDLKQEHSGGQTPVWTALTASLEV